MDEFSTDLSVSKVYIMNKRFIIPLVLVHIKNFHVYKKSLQHKAVCTFGFLSHVDELHFILDVKKICLIFNHNIL